MNKDISKMAIKHQGHCLVCEDVLNVYKYGNFSGWCNDCREEYIKIFGEKHHSLTREDERLIRSLIKERKYHLRQASSLTNEHIAKKFNVTTKIIDRYDV